MTKTELQNYWKSIKSQASERDLANYVQFGIGQNMQNQYGHGYVQWNRCAVHISELNQLKNLRAFSANYNVFLPEGISRDTLTLEQLFEAVKHEGNEQRIFVLHNPSEKRGRKVKDADTQE